MHIIQLTIYGMVQVKTIDLRESIRKRIEKDLDGQEKMNFLQFNQWMNVQDYQYLGNAMMFDF